MASSTTNRLAAAVATVAVGAAITAVVLNRPAKPTPTPPTTTTTRQQADPREHSITCGPNSRPGIPDSAESWANWTIPEYQDRQAFWVQSAGQYGPVLCVVAADKLDTISTDTFDRPGGVLVAMAYMDGVSAAAPYANLKMTGTGYYCVIVRHYPTQPTIPAPPHPTRLNEGRFDATAPTAVVSASDEKGWEGYIAPSTSAGCSNPADSTRMTGLHLTWNEAHPEDYPAAARISLSTAGLPGIGVRCATGWCLLGLTHKSLPPVLHSMSAVTREARARRIIFGWHDDQRLAIRSGAGAGSPLRPSSRATVIPDPQLGTFTVGTVASPGTFHNWTHVANVRISGRPEGKYRDVWKFRAGIDNTVEIRWETDPNQVSSWKVKINGVQNDSLHLKWTDHGSPMYLASTARWVWKSDDDGLWTRCDLGCCEIETLGSAFEQHY